MILISSTVIDHNISLSITAGGAWPMRRRRWTTTSESGLAITFCGNTQADPTAGRRAQACSCAIRVLDQ